MVYVVTNRDTGQSWEITASDYEKAVGAAYRLDYKTRRGVLPRRETGINGRSGVFAVYARRGPGCHHAENNVGPTAGYHAREVVS